MSLAAEAFVATRPKLSYEALRSGVVSLIFISSCYVKFDPAATDLLACLAVLMFFRSGLAFSRYLAPFFLLLLIYNLSGLISYIQIEQDDFQSYQYMVGLALTTVSAIFMAGYIAAEPVLRYRQFEKAYWIGATIGAVFGLVSYFKIQPLYQIFPDFAGRALGGYKDPNVLSTWLVFPVVSMLQAFLIGRLRVSPLSIASFLAIFMTLFLAFSRGAWVDAGASCALMIAFTLALAPTLPQKRRVLFATLVSGGVIAAVLMILLSVPETQKLFLDRFILVKNYDAGETGRFGNQLNAIPILMRLPFGLGPYQYGKIFNLAPHNTFLNAFSSGGWLGGCTYLTLTVVNFYVGFKNLFTRSPFQPFAIAIFASFAVMTLQGMQIDTEHWRHLYWMMGVSWGLFAVNQQMRQRGYSEQDVNAGWSGGKVRDSFDSAPRPIENA